LELVTEGDKDLQKEMLGMVAAEMRSEIPKMRACFESQNWTGLRDVSHKFKSTLAFVGNELMTEANKAVEDIAKSASGTEKLPKLLSMLEDLKPKVSEELEKVYESL
jgi:HPt (histidine-containing phosphotransfer) domain-containing protein